VKFCQKEKLTIKILSKSNFGGFSRQKWEKEKKKKNHQILIFGSHCLAKKNERMIKDLYFISGL